MLPALCTRLDGTVARSRLELIHCVLSCCPGEKGVRFHMTTAFWRKFAPFTSIVKVELPAPTCEGLKLLMTGLGGDVLWAVIAAGAARKAPTNSLRPTALK
jgi:hypothetical protein